jgi:hypothetical protein
MALTSWTLATNALKSKAQNAMLWAKGIGQQEIYALEVDPTTGGIPVVITERVLELKDSVYFNYASDGPVTTADWTELLAATSADVYSITHFDGSGYVTEIGVGAAGLEARIYLSPPGGLPANLSIFIPSGSRVSVRSVSFASIGNNADLVINLLG